MRREEPERVVETFRNHMEINLVHVDAAERFLTQLARRHRPGSRSARSSARHSSASSRQEAGTRLGARSIFHHRAGHHLPRRHRERRTGTRHNGRQHQDAPQRRRPAEGHDLRTRRAAPLPVQRRSPPGRRSASACPRDGLPPALPRPGPRHPHHRRGHRGAARRAPRRRLDRHERNQEAEALPRPLASLRRPHRHPLRRRHGRLPHLRPRRRHSAPSPPKTP